MLIHVVGSGDQLLSLTFHLLCVSSLTDARSKKSLSKLLKALEDEDRLVRESACFALGFLQAASAVEAIADRWSVHLRLLLCITNLRVNGMGIDCSLVSVCSKVYLALSFIAFNFLFN